MPPRCYRITYHVFRDWLFILCVNEYIHTHNKVCIFFFSTPYRSIDNQEVCWSLKALMHFSTCRTACQYLTVSCDTLEGGNRLLYDSEYVQDFTSYQVLWVCVVVSMQVGEGGGGLSPWPSCDSDLCNQCWTAFSFLRSTRPSLLDLNWTELKMRSGLFPAVSPIDNSWVAIKQRWTWSEHIQRVHCQQ